MKYIIILKTITLLSFIFLMFVCGDAYGDEKSDPYLYFEVGPEAIYHKFEHTNTISHMFSFGMGVRWIANKDKDLPDIIWVLKHGSIFAPDFQETSGYTETYHPSYVYVSMISIYPSRDIVGPHGGVFFSFGKSYEDCYYFDFGLYPYINDDDTLRIFIKMYVIPTERDEENKKALSLGGGITACF